VARRPTRASSRDRRARGKLVARIEELALRWSGTGNKKRGAHRAHRDWLSPRKFARRARVVGTVELVMARDAPGGWPSSTTLSSNGPGERVEDQRPLFLRRPTFSGRRARLRDGCTGFPRRGFRAIRHSGLLLSGRAAARPIGVLCAGASAAIDPRSSRSRSSPDSRLRDPDERPSRLVRRATSASIATWQVFARRRPRRTGCRFWGCLGSVELERHRPPLTPRPRLVPIKKGLFSRLTGTEIGPVATDERLDRRGFRVEPRPVTIGDRRRVIEGWCLSA